MGHHQVLLEFLLFINLAASLCFVTWNNKFELKGDDIETTSVTDEENQPEQNETGRNLISKATEQENAISSTKTPSKSHNHEAGLSFEHPPKKEPKLHVTTSKKQESPFKFEQRDSSPEYKTVKFKVQSYSQKPPSMIRKPTNQSKRSRRQEKKKMHESLNLTEYQVIMREAKNELLKDLEHQNL